MNKKTALSAWNFCAVIGLFFFPAGAGFKELSTDVILSKAGYVPDDTVIAVLHVAIPDKYHLYGNPLGPGIGKPALLRLPAGAGVRWIGAYAGHPKKFFPGIGDWVWAYENETYFFCKGVVSKNVPGRIPSWISLQGLVCYTSCIPVSKTAAFDISVGTSAALPVFENYPELRGFAKAVQPMPFDTVSDSLMAKTESIGPISGSIALLEQPSVKDEKEPEWDYEPVRGTISMNLFLALLFGFIAGIILNVMPCVLPVLGIKMLTFAQTGGSLRRTAVARSMIFSAGMISVFMALAALASFAHLSWGQQFQNPWFLIFLIDLTVVFSLGMFDIYMIPLPANVSYMEKKSGRGAVGDFLRGMFATLLATPCSGPFLGATLAWTMTQSTPVIFLVFGAMGLGMASPYVLLSSSKRFLRIIPKSGPWMKNVKYFMGFALLGASVYLMSGLPQDMLVGTVGFCLVTAFAVVMFSLFSPFGSTLYRKIIVAVAACFVLGLGGYVFFVMPHHGGFPERSSPRHMESGIWWKDFSPQLLRSAHSKGQHVIVDFTADWCLNCQYNWVTVLSSDDLWNCIEKKNVLALKADLTMSNKPAESLLHHLGSRSIPFLAVFRGDDPYHPVIMRDILNKKDVIRLLEKLPER